MDSFIQEAYAAGSASASEAGPPPPAPRWKGIKDGKKSVTFLQGTLQEFDPLKSLAAAKLIGRVGYHPPLHFPSDIDDKLDVAWCQWCLGHLSDLDLVAFLKRCHAALRIGGRSLIVVKENLCRDSEDGGPRTVFDKQDSSLTRYAGASVGVCLSNDIWWFRSDLAWKKIFQTAGLKLIKEQIQDGLPEGLYDVKMWDLFYFRR